MIAICNLCPTSTKGKIWFKFANTDWIAHVPSTFPFAYNTVDNGDGTWTLKLRKRIPPGNRYIPNMRYYNATFNTYILCGINATLSPSQGYIYGNPPMCEIVAVPGSVNCQVQYDAKYRDKCGNIVQSPITGNFGRPGSGCSGNFGDVRRRVDSPIEIYQLNLQSSLACNDGCPQGWDEEIFSVTGQGQPQIQIICGDACPSQTVCSCTNGNTTCCYDALGNVIDSF